MGLNSAGICGIYSCCQAHLRLFNQHSNLDGETLNLGEGTLNLNGGTLTLDEGTRLPYNLSTDPQLQNDLLILFNKLYFV